MLIWMCKVPECHTIIMMHVVIMEHIKGWLMLIWMCKIPECHTIIMMHVYIMEHIKGNYMPAPLH